MKIKLLVFSFSIILSYTGCTVTQPKLQNVDFYGEAHKNTIKITKDEDAGDFTFRGMAAFNGKDKLSSQVNGHSKVNSKGVFEVEPVKGETYYIERSGVNTYAFEGENLHWTLPELQSMIELEYNLSSSSAIYGGVTYTKAGGRDLYGYNGGIGFFKEQNTWAIRFDLAGKYHETYVNIDYVQIEDIDLSNNESRKVYFFNADEIDHFFNMNMAFTLNTRRSDWPINVFFNYTLGAQHFYTMELVPDISLTYMEDFKFSCSYNSFSAGIYREMKDDLGRLIIGARYTNYTDPDNDFINPDYFIQLDFNLL